MSITPQTIKDQEFQVKFRGYDTIEVKAYLDLVAEEFFDLHEEKRKQEEEYAELYSKYQSLLEEKESLEKTIQDSEAYSGEAQKEQMAREMELVDAHKRADRFEALVKELEKEKGQLLSLTEGKEKNLEDEFAALRENLAESQAATTQAQTEVEKLRHQLMIAEKNAEELKKDEAIFKSTLLAAQNFADDLRKKSESEAAEMIASARQEVEQIREKAEEELARLPLEIKKLNQQRTEVRDELKKVLTSYLDALEILGKDETSKPDEDCNQLFTSIQLPDEENLQAEAAHLSGNEKSSGKK